MPSSSMKPPASDHFAQLPLDALSGRAFSRIAEAGQTTGNAVRLLRDGTENYPLWLDAIHRAQHSVHLENYILQADETGRRFMQALIDAADRGVRVRVLYDWMGCRGRTSPRFWNRLRRAGVEVRCYNPPHPGSPLGWISRDHRKLLCVDAAVAFTGGLCISQDWLGVPAKGIAPWRDTAVEIRGPAVAQLEAAFADSWKTTGPPIPTEERAPPPTDTPAGDLSLWIIPGCPESMGLYRLQQLVAEVAQRSLWLSDAYFVATTGYARALATAARAGVDVRLLVPGGSDMAMVSTLSRAGYFGLLDAGVRIFEWNGPMMHAKTAVADGCWSRIGSSNSNLASWISNRELDVTIFGADFAEQMEAMFEQDLANATEIILRGSRVGLLRARPRPDGGRRRRRRKGSAGRLLAGAVGLGSAVGATIAQHRVIGSAESRILAIAGTTLIALAAAILLRPGLIAYPVAILAVWVAGSLLTRAWKLRAAGRARPARQRDGQVAPS